MYPIKNSLIEKTEVNIWISTAIGKGKSQRQKKQVTYNDKKQQ